jgi:TPP-dependent pyruvate/acetoin dehydrogenase alpha subunit
LPLIFVCENNQYAVSTRSDSVLALKDFSALAETHGLIALKVNGQKSE